MWPDSPFAIPVSSYQRPVPLVLVDPCDNPDVAIYVRSEWIPYIIGSLKQLMLQTTWATDDPDALNLVQSRASTLLDCVAGSTAPIVCPDNVTEWSDEMAVCESLRFQNGKLQGLCCGVWTDITGQPAQGFQASAIGSGAPQPAPQGCVTYNAAFSAQSTWLLPYPVNTGDTIQVSNAKGASYNSTNTQWQCPDGLLFFAGGCIGSAILNAGNPMPAIASGRLIAKIGATFYDVMAGSPFTVPAGVVNQNVTFQVNYQTLASSGGDLTFDVAVCNNAAAAWTKVFDFTTSNFGSVWTIPNRGNNPAAPGAVYVPGVGYQSALSKFTPSNWFRQVIIGHTKSYNQTSIKAEFTFTPGAYNGNTADQTFYMQFNGAAPVNNVFMPTTPTNPQINNSVLAVTSVNVFLQCGFSPASADPGGQITLSKITITGTGTNPF